VSQRQYPNIHSISASSDSRTSFNVLRSPWEPTGAVPAGSCLIDYGDCFRTTITCYPNIMHMCCPTSQGGRSVPVFHERLAKRDISNNCLPNNIVTISRQHEKVVTTDPLSRPWQKYIELREKHASDITRTHLAKTCLEIYNERR
jgi:hypothetical protein